MNSPTHEGPQGTTSGAVEVITMLGESVVEVQHLEPARTTNKKRSAYMLFGIGALFLLMSLAAFGKGVTNAATNKANLEQWTQVNKKSARSFTGTSLSAAWDYMAFGGLGFGIFAMGWGLVRIRRQDAASSFSVDGHDSPLVCERAGEMVINVPTTMAAELRSSAGITTGSDLAPSFLVPNHGSVRIANGPATFLIRAVVAPRKMPNVVARFDSRAASFLGGSAIAHALLLLLMNTVQPEPKAALTDLGTQDVRMTLAQTNPVEDDPPTPTPDGDDGQLDPSDGGSAGKAGDAGKAGRDDNPNPKGRIAVKGKSSDTKLSKREQLNAATVAGIVGVMKSTNAFSHIDGDSWITEGMDAENTYGPGTEPGDGGGTFGHHRYGFGPGGDGPNGIISSGQYRIKGPTGPGNMNVPGRRRPPGLDHKTRGPATDLGKGTADGGLDEAIVRRYIQRKVRTIRNCYERELLAHPGLSGTLVTRFIINASGNVLGASASGMNNSALKTCVASVLSTIKFPKTEDGSIAKVKYPFRFTNR